MCYSKTHDDTPLLYSLSSSSCVSLLLLLIPVYSKTSIVAKALRMSSAVVEVLGFLNDDKADVRNEAVKILAQLVDSTTVDHFYEKNHFSKLIDCFATQASADLVQNAAILLINIVAEKAPATRDGARLAEIVCGVLKNNSAVEFTNIYLMLLANLTVSEDICASLVQNCFSYLQPFMENYLNYNPQLEDKSMQDFSEIDRWQFFSNILCNICRLEQGRKFVLNKTSGNMARLLTQVRLICVCK
jgi:hypothetical protein